MRASVILGYTRARCTYIDNLMSEKQMYVWKMQQYRKITQQVPHIQIIFVKRHLHVDNTVWLVQHVIWSVVKMRHHYDQCEWYRQTHSMLNRLLCDYQWTMLNRGTHRDNWEAFMLSIQNRHYTSYMYRQTCKLSHIIHYKTLPQAY